MSEATPDWYKVELVGVGGHSDDPKNPACDDPRCQPVQRVEGTPDVVGAWLRAVADRINPPKRPTRGRGADSVGHHGVVWGDGTPGYDILPRPTP